LSLVRQPSEQPFNGLAYGWVGTVVMGKAVQAGNMMNRDRVRVPRRGSS
jgi:hypothetical protein